MPTAKRSLRPPAVRVATLFGRDRELRALAERVDAARAEGGGALVVRGPAGIGKSCLLDAARAHAASREFQILATTGIQSETHLAFAGLHQLLRPVLRAADRAPETYGLALRTAFGLSDGPAPSPFQIALAVLDLLGECAESGPIVLIVDDAQWLDRSTADALAFVARRLESDPIVLLVAVRDDFESPLLEVRLPELRVPALAAADAASLLRARAPDLPPALHARILNEAGGNPLALVELPVALAATADPGARAAEMLPLTERLEQAFADRVATLGSGARALLHVAVTNESGVLAELLRAAATLEDREITLDTAAEAEVAGLIEIEGTLLRFRHPLMRSAIHQSMSARERRAAHTAWAKTLEDDPDRHAWHRAAAALGGDDTIADALEAAATRASQRGAPGVAFAALERAAQLTTDPKRRGTRLMHAAYLGLDLGRPRDVERVLGAIDEPSLRPLDRPHVAWLRELNEGTWSGASRIASFVEIAERKRVRGETDFGLSTLRDVAMRCWWSRLDDGTRRSLVAVAERFPVPEHDPRLLYVLAMADPVGRGAAVLDRLSRHGPDVTPEASGMLGAAALAVGDLARAERHLETQIHLHRSLGLLGALAPALAMQAWTKIPRGDWLTARSTATEASRWSEEVGVGSFWKVAADLAAATVAAYRGEVDTAEKLAAAGEQTLLPRGANPLLALVQFARGAAALAASRHDEAFQHLRRVFDRADTAFHPHVRSWALVDLAEAAAHSGHEHEALSCVQELESIAARSGSPLLAGALAFARPVVAPGDEAAFHAGAELATWPFTRARLQLAYGLWLRRHRRAADARAPLRAARDAFDALGAVPWGERARQELRASGETSRRRSYDLTDSLSPQELQIAQLAAAGLSNKEIGRQLFLSHRTIGSHLYRIFPKLGITARSHLSAALRDGASPSSD
jgi:DNA-binding CsgD family transcriptional regulator